MGVIALCTTRSDDGSILSCSSVALDLRNPVTANSTDFAVGRAMSPRIFRGLPLGCQSTCNCFKLSVVIRLMIYLLLTLTDGKLLSNGSAGPNLGNTSQDGFQLIGFRSGFAQIEDGAWRSFSSWFRRDIARHTVTFRVTAA